MNAFKIIKSSDKVTGGENVKTIQISKKNKARMTPEDIREVAKLLVKTINKKYKKNAEIGIRGLAPDMYKTLKRRTADIDDVLDDEDYFNGRPQEETKFQKYETAEFSIYY